jgi:hypothetical protein
MNVERRGRKRSMEKDEDDGDRTPPINLPLELSKLNNNEL